MRFGLLVAVLLVSRPVSAEVVRPFPPGFLWGTAISAFQSEMGVGAPTDPNSDWWVWVRDPDNITDAKVSGDLPEDGPGFWTLYNKDARLARSRLHSNALRLSLDWSRLFPSPTTGVDISGGIDAGVLAALDALADQAAVTHYRDVLAAVRARGLEPMVTVNHFTLPLWIHDPIATREAFAGVGAFDDVPPGLTQAGWLDPAIVDEFTKLAAYVAWKFGDQVDLWCTINEPLVILINGFLNIPGVGGNFPPGLFNVDGLVKSIPQLVAAHARAYDQLHALDTVDADGDGVAVAAGVVHNMSAFHPADPMDAGDMTAAQHADYLVNRVLLNAITSGAFDANLDGDTTDPGEMRPDLAGRSDFIGVNYYLRARVDYIGFVLTPRIPLLDFNPIITYQTPHSPSAPPCPTVCTDFGWEIYPPGLREVLTFVGSLGLPVYVTENGIADAADTQRGQYIVDHLATLQDVITDGVADVRGYFHWSLTDNFEWSSGYYPQFGLFTYDPQTGRRHRRRGAFPFARIAKYNGITRFIARRFGL